MSQIVDLSFAGYEAGATSHMSKEKKLTDAYRKNRRFGRLTALMVGIAAFLCLATPNAYGLVQFDYHGYGLGGYGEAYGNHSRHIVGSMAVYQGSGNVTVCEGARYSNSFNIARQSCGVNGSGHALNMESFYDGSSMWTFIRNPSSNSIGPVLGRWYVDWSTSWPGEQMHRISSMTSRNGKYRATIEWDGNFVLWNNHSGKVCWQTGTAGHHGAYAWMQNDGNFVVYAPNGTPLFWTGTNGQNGAYIRMQNDGNLVVYKGSTPLWWTGTVNC